MIRLVYGADRVIAHWVSQRIAGAPEFKNYAAIGIATDTEIIGGVVYADQTQSNIVMSIAATDPNWCSKGRLHALFYYPFAQLGLPRVTALVAKNNKRSRRMNEGLGFKLEGVMRQGAHGKDLMIYGMLKDECKWIQ